MLKKDIITVGAAAAKVVVVEVGKIWQEDEQINGGCDDDVKQPCLIAIFLAVGGITRSRRRSEDENTIVVVVLFY